VSGGTGGVVPPGPALTSAFRAEVRDWLAAHVPAEPLPSLDAASLTRLWRSLAAPLRARRGGQRGIEHQPPRRLAALPRSSR
jgi:hypothetical protein